MQHAFFRPFQCPGCSDEGWILVAIRGKRVDADVRAIATHSEAISALSEVMNSETSEIYEAFIRRITCPGPTGELLIWFGDDPSDVNVRALPTRLAAWSELATLLEADVADPDAAADAAELRRMVAAETAETA